MFNNKPENEADFCESYKSQILNNHSNESESSFNTILKTLIIILLLAIIIGLSIYGYNYFINKSTANQDSQTPPSSIQISDDDLKVTIEEVEEETSVAPVVKSVEKVEPKKIEKIVEEIKEVSVETVKKVEPIVIKEEPIVVAPPSSIQSGESDLDKLANELKLSIAQSEEKKIDSLNEKFNEESLGSIENDVKEEPELEVPVPTSPESKYLEELAELSKEIDKEMKH